MITFIQTHATEIVSFLTLISNIIFVCVVIAMITHATTRESLSRFVHKYILELVFYSTLSAVVGSLVYSEIVGFPPCDLCWYGRMAMYPIALLAGMAMIRKDKGILDYIVPFSILGALVSLFHSLIQWGLISGSALACTSAGGACARVYVNEYSYITIPFMALSIFVYIIALKYIYYRHNKILSK